ncbi:MAG: GNAT family N-acetyltransferase [Blastocatellia bacterium]
METSFQRASFADTRALTEIAFAAKRHWDYPESWIEAWREDLTITSDFIERQNVYAANVADKLIGFYALVVNESVTELDHLWVLPEWIGKGIGRRLLNHALDHAAAIGAQQIEIVSDPNAEGFYLKAGARKIGEVISTIEGQQRRLPRLAIDIFNTGDTPK